MSTPLLQQPPPVQVTQQAYTTQTGHGSVGPVIAILAVIAILGVIAGMIGRLCSGRRVMGQAHYDVETWVEIKCSSCVDGRVTPPPPPPPPPPAESTAGEDAAPAATAVPVEVSPEMKADGEDDHDDEEEEEDEEAKRSSHINGN